MTRGLKILTVLALIALTGGASSALFANCQETGVYEILQCGTQTWFAPLPADAGHVFGAWWALGMGNNTAVQTTALVAPGGSGWINPTAATTNGTFIGVDSGTLPALVTDAAVSLDLTDATLLPINAPAGALCFSARANWGSPGIDSCIDVNRSAATLGGVGDLPGQSDNYVNRYWDVSPGDTNPYTTPPYGYFLNHQLDPPLGVLLTEGNGKYFAAAFFASQEKLTPKNESFDTGNFNMADLKNGLPNVLGQPNVVPWQPIPNPNVSAVIVNPADPQSVRNLSLNWGPPPGGTNTAPTIIHDQSTRPCFQTDAVTPCATLGTATGVGVLDQGVLIHYEVEVTTLDAASVCGTTWTPVAGTRVDFPATTVAANAIPAQSCVRLKTSFGRTPSATMVLTPIGAAGKLTNAQNTQRGSLGDIGYFVTSPVVKVGGPLVSQNANLSAVEKKQGNLHVVFSTDAELNVTSFDVVGINAKGGSKVIGTVACKQCTSGLSASYDELLSGTKLQGAKSIQIVVQPSGTKSNTLELR